MGKFYFGYVGYVRYDRYVGDEERAYAGHLSSGLCKEKMTRVNPFVSPDVPVVPDVPDVPDLPVR
jgi:hypothetical protein